MPNFILFPSHAVRLNILAKATGNIAFNTFQNLIQSRCFEEVRATTEISDNFEATLPELLYQLIPVYIR